jgi:hypothetical protein
MGNLLKKSILLMAIFALFASCGDIAKKVEDKMKVLNEKTLRLDSLVNKEFSKIPALDSLINMKGDKIKKLDSIINKSSSKFDSISNEKINLLKKFINK